MATSTDDPNLPQDYYCGFDVRQTPDGGKEYALPHTVGVTVDSLFWTRKTLLVVVTLGGITGIVQFVFAQQPLGETVIAAVFAFGLGALIAIWLWVEFTGYRVVTYIGIRAEGLVWERAHFYPRNHIWEICYGITQKHRETGEERFVPKIEIQVGVHVLVLAEDLEPMPAKLFEHLFRQDTRRYWHGHN